jgi:hypothetical protein
MRVTLAEKRALKSFLDGGGYFGEWYSAGLFTEISALLF